MNIEALTNAIVQEVMKRITEIQTHQMLRPENILVLDEVNDTNAQEYHYITSVYPNITFLNNLTADDGVEAFDYIFIPKLTNKDLSGIALGLAHTDISRIAIEGLLYQKNIIVLEEGIAYRRYRETANVNLYQLFEDYEGKLCDYGIEIVQKEQLHEAVISEEKKLQTDSSKSSHDTARYMVIDKKLITERDMEQVSIQGYNTIHIQKKSIVTPLALDYIRMRHMNIIRT